MQLPKGVRANCSPTGAFGVPLVTWLAALCGWIAVAFAPLAIGEDAGAATTPDEAPIETIEDALDQPASPLDSVAEGIANTEFDEAQEFLSRYINAIESAHHRFHQDLARPLMLLGDSHMGKGEYGEALNQYQRAVHINRVNNGLYAPEQVEAVYKEAESLQALGDLAAANDREEYAYEVQLKTFGPFDLAMLPGTYRLAEWYRQTYNVFAARGLYENAIRIHEANGTGATPAAIRAHEGLVDSYLTERFPPIYIDEGERMTPFVPARSTRTATYTQQQLYFNSAHKGEESLQHIISIQKADPNTDPLIVAEAILKLADWHLMFESYRKSHPLYEHAFELLTEIESIDQDEFFREPKLLHIPLPGDPKAPPPALREEERLGFVEVAYRISANGTTQNLKTVGSEPTGLMDFRVRRSLRAARYRPQIVEGKPIPTEGLSYRHEFSYFPKRETPSPGDS